MCANVYMRSELLKWLVASSAFILIHSFYSSDLLELQGFFSTMFSLFCVILAYHYHSFYIGNYVTMCYKTQNKKRVD